MELTDLYPQIMKARALILEVSEAVSKADQSAPYLPNAGLVIAHCGKALDELQGIFRDWNAKD
jgi:hypothetical protein